MARDGAAAAPAARKIKLKVGGAKEGTRTLTGVTRWNLNPVRLPIPPLSHRSPDCKLRILNDFLGQLKTVERLPYRDPGAMATLRQRDTFYGSVKAEHKRRTPPFRYLRRPPARGFPHRSQIALSKLSSNGRPEDAAMRPELH